MEVCRKDMFQCLIKEGISSGIKVKRKGGLPLDGMST